jgi:hypothetical protein
LHDKRRKGVEMSIRKRLLFMCLILVLGHPGATTAQVARHLASLHMPASPNRFVFDGLDIPLEQEEIAVDVELGDTIFGQAIVLVPRDGAEQKNFRVQAQYETSLTILWEGAHRDLLDWKHFRSEWSDLEQLGDVKFRMPTYTDEEASRFPTVSSKEIYQAVREAGGSNWAERVKQVRGPNEYPASVGISTLRLRILVQEESEWRELHRIEFKLPMGC